MVVPVELGRLATRVVDAEDETCDELAPGSLAPSAEGIDQRARHVEVQSAFALAETDVSDAVAIAGHLDVRVVVPVLRRATNRRHEAPNVGDLAGGAGRDDEVGVRHPDVDAVGPDRAGQVDPESGPAWQGRVEQLDREVAADATVGEMTAGEHGPALVCE